MLREAVLKGLNKEEITVIEQFLSEVEFAHTVYKCMCLHTHMQINACILLKTDRTTLRSII